MARIFTTSFEFNHQRYDAIVTVTTQQGQLNFNIKLLDADLHQFFPDGQVSYQGSTGFAQLDNLDNTIAQSILRKIEAAIKQNIVIS